ncbi:MAG TPA: undecaprenyl-diphosphate phosphatase [Planctomycetia bacterium]|nr:undecaprenyl-diphosphate phosphatase [Planctomycetia bacterium]
MPRADDISLGFAILLGALQGVAEFLPISSTGHLALAEHFLGIRKADSFFDVMLHLGTLAAVVWHYRRSLAGRDEGESDAFPLHDRKRWPWIATLLAVAMTPAVAAVIAFPKTKPDQVPSARTKVGDLRANASQTPGVVLGFLACTGAVLVVAGRTKPGPIGPQEFGIRHALAIGAAQALSALCPGLSRSGMTISMSLALGVRPATAVHFSLLLSIPTILAASVHEARDVSAVWMSHNAGATLAGAIVAAVIGWASIGLLAGAVKRGRWGWFAFYLWALAAAGGLWLAVTRSA